MCRTVECRGAGAGAWFHLRKYFNSQKFKVPTVIEKMTEEQIKE